MAQAAVLFAGCDIPKDERVFSDFTFFCALSNYFKNAVAETAAAQGSINPRTLLRRLEN